MSHSFNDDELEKLNIENLFATRDGVKPFTNGTLDINTLFINNNKNAKDFKFDSNILLMGVRKRKQKKQECYLKMYKSKN